MNNRPIPRHMILCETNSGNSAINIYSNYPTDSVSQIKIKKFCIICSFAYYEPYKPQKIELNVYRVFENDFYDFKELGPKDKLGIEVNIPINDIVKLPFYSSPCIFSFVN